jgi:transmembrane sensor
MFYPNDPQRTDPSSDKISQAAAGWLVRRDRGLSAAEQEAFEQWLAADPRHRPALERSSQAWQRLDLLSTEREFGDERAAAHRPRLRLWPIALAMAASLAVVGMGWRWLVPREVPSHPPRAVLLADGTFVRLNENSEFAEKFTSSVRQVVLVRGEAHFRVRKDPNRPFVVCAGPTEVVAVGTVFDVDLQPGQTEVVVTEGKVRVASDLPGPSLVPGPTEGVLVQAGQQAKVGHKPFFSPRPVAVSASDPQNLARVLAWADPLTTLTDTTLGDLAADFQRRLGYRLVLASPELASLRIGGRFHLDDVDDFVRLLAENFGLDVQKTGPGETVLRLRG